MRKIFKLLFGRITIGILLMLLQIFMIISSILRINEYLVYFDIFLQLLSLVVVVIIINKKSNPTYKLAWIVPILIFPMFGGLLYLFVSGQTHTKYFFNRLFEIESEVSLSYPQKEEDLIGVSSLYPERESTVRFVNNVSGGCVYKNTYAEYYPLGEDKFRSLLKELEKAEKYIFLEYFIIKPGKMWNSILEVLKKKAAAGVDVRVMYDGMGSMTTLPVNYKKKLHSYGIKCCVFSPFTPFLSAVQNNRDHRKILVIDGKTAYTGGINLSDEYINIDYPGGHWKDTAVMIKGEAAFSFTKMFLQLWWHQTKTKENIKDFESNFKTENDVHDGYVMPYSDKPQDEYQTGEFIYLDIINKAKKYIHITTPYLILDNEMVVALTNAALSGIDVKIICPKSIDHWYARSVAFSFYKELTESGVKIYEYSPGFIHGKTFVSDDEVAVIGSINLDYRSLYLHFECATWFLGSHIVENVENDFAQTLSKCREITLEECNKRNPVRKLFSAILRLFGPLM